MTGPEAGMAVIVVFPDGPPTPAEGRKARESAWQAMHESFRDRGIPTPPGGWQFAMLNPDEDWRRWVSPPKVPETEALLAGAGPRAVVGVYYAYRLDLWCPPPD